MRIQDLPKAERRVIALRLRELKVELCSFDDVSAFIEQHHYSKSVKGITSSFCFRITHDGQMIGAQFSAVRL